LDIHIDRRIIQGIAALALIAILAILVFGWWLGRETGATDVVEWAVEEQVEEARRALQPPPSDPKPDTFASTRIGKDGKPLARCPARLVVEDADGNPLAGAAKIGLPPDVWKTLDEDGTAEWSARYCDLRQSVHLRFPDGSKTSQRVPFEDGNEVVLVIAQQHTAWLLPVDAAGAPVEATVRPGKRLEDGRYALSGRHDRIGVTLGRPGEHGHQVVIDLDETVHEIEVQPDREVWIELLCDQCSGRLTCEDDWLGRRECLGDGELYSCPCPTTDATLWLHTPNALLDYQSHSQPLAMVPAEAETLTVDVRGELGAIRICVDPSVQTMPQFEVRRPDTRYIIYSFRKDDLEDGCLLLDGLLPGPWEVECHPTICGAPSVQPALVRSDETTEVSFDAR